MSLLIVPVAPEIQLPLGDSERHLLLITHVAFRFTRFPFALLKALGNSGIDLVDKVIDEPGLIASGDIFKRLVVPVMDLQFFKPAQLLSPQIDIFQQHRKAAIKKPRYFMFLNVGAGKKMGGHQKQPDIALLHSFQQTLVPLLSTKQVVVGGDGVAELL